MSVPPLGTIDHWSRACQTHSENQSALGGEKHLAATQQIISESPLVKPRHPSTAVHRPAQNKNNDIFLSFFLEMLMERLADTEILTGFNVVSFIVRAFFSKAKRDVNCAY